MTAPLTAISAAVVGVIASLALFFGMHVFHPAGRWDWPAVLIAAAAAIALMRYQQGTIRVLLACAIAGVVLSYRV
jgi:chromate transporter